MPLADDRVERRAKRFWVSLVVLLLGMQLVIGGFAIYLATGDPSVAVVPDYHTAALNWDAAKQADLAAARMGWTVDVTTSDVADDRGMRATEVVVVDEAGTPVDTLRINVRAYRHARARDVKTFELPSVGKGRYLALAPVRQPGIWQFDVTIEGAKVPMSKSAEIEIP